MNSNGGSSSGGAQAASTSSNPANDNNNNNNKNNSPTLVHRKVAILGFRAVGKSSLANSFVTGSFSEAYDPTIESTHHKTIRFRKVHFATDIVDTAGMDEFSRLSRNASLGVHGYVLVFSITSRQSFDMIQQVNEALLNTLGDVPDVPRVLVGSMKDLQYTNNASSNSTSSSSTSTPISTSPSAGPTGSGGSNNDPFFGNGRIHHNGGGASSNSNSGNSSATAPAGGRQVSYADAQSLADSWGNVPYIECSSKTGENVPEVFHTLLKEIEKDDGLLAETGDGGCILL